MVGGEAQEAGGRQEDEDGDGEDGGSWGEEKE